MRNKGVPAAPSGHSAEPEPISVVSAADAASVPNAAFYKELLSILADCSNFLGETTLGDRCEAMLAQVVADEAERQAEVGELRTALVDHNDALRSAAQVAGRDGKGTNWLIFRGRVHWVLAEHREITNEARAASAGEAGTATDSEAGVAEGEHATAAGGDAQDPQVQP
jgi:hypothetical protein